MPAVEPLERGLVARRRPSGIERLDVNDRRGFLTQGGQSHGEAGHVRFDVSETGKVAFAQRAGQTLITWNLLHDDEPAGGSGLGAGACGIHFSIVSHPVAVVCRLSPDTVSFTRYRPASRFLSPRVRETSIRSCEAG